MPEHDSLSAVEIAVLRAGIPRDARLLVAVSGGADSVALLSAIITLSAREDCRSTVFAGHVNHGLRGAESDADETFVRDITGKLGVRVEVARANVATLAAQRKQSIEAVAREERYRHLWEMWGRLRADLLLTAHTEDDQAETLLLHLLRGAGPTGLAAMRSRSGRLLRPLLAVGREAVLAYVQERALPYRLDSSNLDDSHLRNRVRHEVMPVLRRLNPAAVQVLARSASIARADRDYLVREAEAALLDLHVETSDAGIFADLPAWRVLHPALRRATLRSLITRILGSPRDLTFNHIATVELALLEREESFQVKQLPHGLALSATSYRFRLTRTAPVRHRRLAPTRIPIPGEVSLPAGVVRAQMLATCRDELPRLRTVCGPYHALCDAAVLGLELTVRSRRAGDRMRPHGLGGTRKVQDMLVDDKVPEAERDRVLIIENFDHIVWIPGHALDERAAIRDDRQEVVHLTYVPVEGPLGARIFRHFQP
jgi:tRNA(Ile)-lysidine synthase